VENEILGGEKTAMLEWRRAGDTGGHVSRRGIASRGLTAGFVAASTSSRWKIAYPDGPLVGAILGPGFEERRYWLRVRLGGRCPG